MSLQDVHSRGLLTGDGQNGRGQCLLALKTGHIIVSGVRRTRLGRVKITGVEHAGVVAARNDHAAGGNRGREIAVFAHGVRIGVWIDIGDSQVVSRELRIFVQQLVNGAVIGILLEIVLVCQDGNRHGVLQIGQRRFGVIGNLIQLIGCQIEI